MEMKQNNTLEESYQRALECIKVYTRNGLSNLSLIEKVGLRRIVSEVITEEPKYYDCGIEAAEIFLANFYDWAPDYKIKSLYRLLKRSNREDFVARYFQRKQDQSHLI